GRPRLHRPDQRAHHRPTVRCLFLLSADDRSLSAWRWLLYGGQGKLGHDCGTARRSCTDAGLCTSRGRWHIGRSGRADLCGSTATTVHTASLPCDLDLDYAREPSWCARIRPCVRRTGVLVHFFNADCARNRRRESTALWRSPGASGSTPGAV